MHLTAIAPEELSPDEHHVRGRTEVTDAFVRNVREVGVVEPPLAREVDGRLRLIDGVRRVRAAEEAGLDELSVLVRDLDDAQAALLSVEANLDCWYKAPSESDEEQALMQLVTGERRSPRPWLEDGSNLRSARYSLGLVSDADVLLDVFGDVEGFGPSRADGLADAVDDVSDVLDLSEDEFRQVDGIGPTLARRLSNGGRPVALP